MTREKRTASALDPSGLERLALRYVERFATSRGKLTQYLERKIRERGWDAAVAADPAGVAQRMADLRYVDDRAYAEAKVAAMTRRGLGARRVAIALRQAQIDEADTREVEPAVAEHAIDSALTFARRRRIGPFGPPGADRALREKQIAAMLRAGHGFDLSRKIVHAEREIGPDDLF